jgi:hypothetical protein
MKYFGICMVFLFCVLIVPQKAFAASNANSALVRWVANGNLDVGSGVSPGIVVVGSAIIILGGDPGVVISGGSDLDKFQETKELSTDGGATWVPTSETRWSFKSDPVTGQLSASPTQVVAPVYTSTGVIPVYVIWDDEASLAEGCLDDPLVSSGPFNINIVQAKILSAGFKMKGETAFQSLPNGGHVLVSSSSTTGTSDIRFKVVVPAGCTENFLLKIYLDGVLKDYKVVPWSPGTYTYSWNVNDAFGVDANAQAVARLKTGNGDDIDSWLFWVGPSIEVVGDIQLSLTDGVCHEIGTTSSSVDDDFDPFYDDVIVGGYEEFSLTSGFLDGTYLPLGSHEEARDRVHKVDVKFSLNKPATVCIAVYADDVGYDPYVEKKTLVGQKGENSLAGWFIDTENANDYYVSVGAWTTVPGDEDGTRDPDSTYPQPAGPSEETHGSANDSGQLGINRDEWGAAHDIHITPFVIGAGVPSWFTLPVQFTSDVLDSYSIIQVILVHLTGLLDAVQLPSLPGTALTLPLGAYVNLIMRGDILINGRYMAPSGILAEDTCLDTSWVETRFDWENEEGKHVGEYKAKHQWYWTYGDFVHKIGDVIIDQQQVSVLDVATKLTEIPAQQNGEARFIMHPYWGGLYSPALVVSDTLSQQIGCPYWWPPESEMEMVFDW